MTKGLSKSTPQLYHLALPFFALCLGNKATTAVKMLMNVRHSPAPPPHSNRYWNSLPQHVNVQNRGKGLKASGEGVIFPARNPL